MVDYEANAPHSVKQRVADARVRWAGPVVAVLARLAFAATVQLVLASVLAATGAAQPVNAAAGWWMVYGTIVDVGALALLAWLIRREGIGVRSLLGPAAPRIPRDLLIGLGLALALIPAIAVSALITRLVYGDALPPQIAVVDLPLPAAIYSVLVWPLGWAVVEQLTYLGYALPRLEALTGRSWLAATLVAGFWAVQHAALPLLLTGDGALDWTFLIYRIVSSLPVTAAVTLLYFVVRRRLLPLMTAHWLSNTAAAASASVS